jgi:hypothetical protein
MDREQALGGQHAGVYGKERDRHAIEMNGLYPSFCSHTQQAI